MTPNELYAREPESISRSFSDVNGLKGTYYDLIPEVREIPWSGDSEVEIHYYKDFNFDGRRIWRLGSVKFQDEFVMIFQNAGREGDDHAERFITNWSLYKDMVEYLLSLGDEDIPPEADIYDPSLDIDGLDEFYGAKLDGIFERYE